MEERNVSRESGHTARVYQEWQAKFPELVDEIVAAAKAAKTE